MKYRTLLQRSYIRISQIEINFTELFTYPFLNI